MEIKQAVKALSALAQVSRLDVFRLLVRAGPEGLPAGQISEELEVPPATLSFHLNQLSNAGLIQDRRDGRSVIYSLDVVGMGRLMEFLTEDCCQGRPELCSTDKVCCGPNKATKRRKR